MTPGTRLVVLLSSLPFIGSAFIYLLGRTDGAQLKGADGKYLYGNAP